MLGYNEGCSVWFKGDYGVGCGGCRCERIILGMDWSVVGCKVCREVKDIIN